MAGKECTTIFDLPFSIQLAITGRRYIIGNYILDRLRPYYYFSLLYSTTLYPSELANLMTGCMV